MSEEKRPVPKKKRNRQRSGKARVAGAMLYALLVVALSAVLATLGWLWANDLLALNKEYASTIVTIPESSIVTQQVKEKDGTVTTVSRADLNSITRQLKEEGLIRYEFLFKLYSRLSGADRKIVAGTYELDTEMDYRALVVNMGRSSATRQTVDITIPEGYNVDQIFRLLEENNVSTVEKLQDMAAEWPYKWDFLQDIPLGDYHRLEGYLFPDTYTFYLGEDPKYVLNKMMLRFDEKMGQFYEQIEENGSYTLHQIVTIASLIEEETDGYDYRDIASVLYNRLNDPNAETAGFLQIDAALVYINGGHAPTLEDKEIDSPYNTYLYQGLTPGPITNPGMTSLYAAIEPNNTRYFYYALNPATGRHEFSRTYQEHMNRLASFSND